MPTSAKARDRLLLALSACVVLAALSLVAARQPDYDPYAWIIWGREIVHGDLSTVGGPSWKPLPVLFTTPFALLGDAAAPTLWVLVARIGGLVSIVLAYRVAHRLAGFAAGVAAAAALAIADGYALGFTRGASEGLLVAFALAAVECHLAGRRAGALAALAAAALVRPEVWPFLAASALWLVVARTRARGAMPWGTVLALAALGAAILLAWFVPERIGSGSLLRGASRAQEAVSGSPAQASRPFAAVFTHAASSLAVPVYVAAVAGVLLGWRCRDRPAARVALALAGISTLLMVAVGVLAEIGFTGNPRYVTLPASLVCVLAGVGVAWGVPWLRDRAPRGRAATALACLLLAGVAVGVAVKVAALGGDVARLRREDRLYSELPDVIASVGGPNAVTSCAGRVYTGPLQTQALAWALRVQEREVDIYPRPPGVVVVPDYEADGIGNGFPHTWTRDNRWTVRASCTRP